MKPTRHTLRWFQNRRGKTIYRKPIRKEDGTVCCDMCERGWVKVGGNKFGLSHAQYLYDCQNDLGISYFDHPVV